MSSKSGFTLIELMVTLVVLSVVLALGIPSLQEMMIANRLAAESNAMLSTLLLARSESIKRRTSVTVCKSADGAACVTSNDWDQGWIVFVDTDGDATVDTGETILAAHQNLPPGLTLTGNTGVANFVSYVAAGRTTQWGTLTLCHTSSGEARTLTINRTGRPAVGTGAC